VNLDLVNRRSEGVLMTTSKSNLAQILRLIWKGA
jgi:hypothetical protein